MKTILIGIFLLSLILFTTNPPSKAMAVELFVKPSGAGTACTQANPCSLETALAQAADDDAIYVAGGTYTGTGDAVITLTKSVALYGSWKGNASGYVVRDPDAYPTTLDGENARRVITITGNISPTVDRFVITRGNATGLTTNCFGDCGKPDGCGGGIFVFQAGVLISNNVITDNVAAVTSLGSPDGTTGYGGGIYVYGGHGAIITGNTISNNSGSLAANGGGGGVYIESSCAGTQILRNRILSNVATSAASAGWGGGIHLSSSIAIVQDNLIQGNVASTQRSSMGSGIFQWYGAPTIRGNVVTENNRGEAVYLGHSEAQFEANLVLKNDTDIGVYLIYGEGAGPTLTNNIIAENEINNFTAESSSTYPITASFINNTLVGKGNNSDTSGVYVGANSTVIMKNTIIAGHAVGIAVGDPTGSISPDHTLFWNNGDDGTRGTDPVDGDPAFKDPTAGDYHIGPASAVINAGADAGVTTDIDGQARDPFPDIGADEYVSLPDLIGEWTSMTQTCKYGKKGPTM